MAHEFDRTYWDEHWQARDGSSTGQGVPPNPYVLAAAGDLAPGTALDAGCGEGAEAIWLARAGWTVTAADIADAVLSRAAEQAAAQGVGDRVHWVLADLTAWDPNRTFDLVMTHYAHPSMPQLEFYDRLASWVAPGGSLLVVGHRHADEDAHHGRGARPDHGAPHDDHHDRDAQGGHHHDPGDRHDDHPPAEASVTAASITERLDPGVWEVVIAEEPTRTVDLPAGGQVTLGDVVVRAVRRTGGR